MRRTIVVIAVLATVLALGTMVASAKTTHCEGHSSATKVEGPGQHVVDGLVVTIDGPTVTFTDEAGNPVEVDFCVKASTGNSGPRSGSSFTVDWVNGGGNTPDISYVVVYGDDEEDPCVIDPEGCL